MLSLFGYILYETFHQSIHHNYDRHLRFEAEQLLPFIQTDDSLFIDLSGYSRNEALKSGVEYGTYVKLYDKNSPIHPKSIHSAANGKICRHGHFSTLFQITRDIFVDGWK